MRLKIGAGIRAHFIFIRIYHIGPGILVQRLHDLKESIRLQGIVMIAEHQKFPSCQGHSRVGICGDPAVALQLHIRDPLFPSVIPVQVFTDLFVRASVRQTELPVPVCLLPHGIDQLFQIGKGRTVKRDDDTYQRHGGKYRSFLFPQCGKSRQAPFSPLLIILSVLRSAFAETSRKTFFLFLFSQFLYINFVCLFTETSQEFQDCFFSASLFHGCGDPESDLLLLIPVVQIPPFHHVRPAASCHSARKGASIPAEKFDLRVSSLVHSPALDLHHGIIEHLRPVYMIFKQTLSQKLL